MANSNGMMYPVAGAAQSTAMQPMLNRYTHEGKPPVSDIRLTLGNWLDLSDEQSRKTLIMCGLTAAAALALGWWMFKR